MADVTIIDFFKGVVFLTLFFAEYTLFTWIIERIAHKHMSPTDEIVIGVYVVWFATVLQTFISFGLTTVTVNGVVWP